MKPISRRLLPQDSREFTCAPDSRARRFDSSEASEREPRGGSVERQERLSRVPMIKLTNAVLGGFRRRPHLEGRDGDADVGRRYMPRRRVAVAVRASRSPAQRFIITRNTKHKHWVCLLPHEYRTLRDTLSCCAEQRCQYGADREPRPTGGNAAHPRLAG